MKLIALVTLLALVFAANCWTYEGHEMKGDASKAVYDGIKKDLLAFLPTLINRTTAAALEKDLKQTDTKKMTLNEIDNASVAQIFTFFGLKDPGCDKNGNGKVDGEETACLGKLWKYYVPS